LANEDNENKEAGLNRFREIMETLGEKEMKKRTVIVLGAGAAIPWGAPTTWDISLAILGDTAFKTTTNLNAGVFICRKLISYYSSITVLPASMSNEDLLNEAFEIGINFETIINALEDLYSYYFNKTASGGASWINSRPAWFDLSPDVDELFNFDFRANTGVDERGTLINKASKAEYDYCVEERQETLYLNEINKHYLSIISQFVSGYDAHCEAKKEVNADLLLHLKKRKENGEVLRIYTTNYDHLWPKVLKKEIDLFNGFDLPIEAPGIRKFGPDIQHILTKRDEDCYYNLHGSVYFEYKTANFLGTDNLGKFIYQPDFSVSEVGQHGSAYVNPSESIKANNIITGYSKVQRTFLEPIKAFHHSLAMDCMEADEVVTIGYSFSDHHINRSIRYAFLKDADTPITHVSFGETSEFLGSPEYKGLENTISSAHELITHAEENKINKTIKSENSMIFLGGLNNYLKKY